MYLFVLLFVQKEVGEGVCEYHIFDPGNFAHKMPKELKRGNYHQWGLKKQDANSTPNADGRYQGLHDIIKLLGHEHLDTIDIFKIDCEKVRWVECDFSAVIRRY